VAVWMCFPADGCFSGPPRYGDRFRAHRCVRSQSEIELVGGQQPRHETREQQCAFFAPTVSEGSQCRIKSGGFGVSTPVTLAGVVSPNPTAVVDGTSPALAGLVVVMTLLHSSRKRARFH